MHSAHSQEATLFVLFKPAAGAGAHPKWPPIRPAAGWWWVGSGSTPWPALPGEEQYSGPLRNRDVMKARLQRQYAAAKARGIVAAFKLRTRYPRSAPTPQ